MQAMEALQQAAANAGKPLTRIGLEMGKSRQFVHSTMRKGSIPQCNTMAKMLQVCGYRLVALPESEPLPGCALVIDGEE